LVSISLASIPTQTHPVRMEPNHKVFNKYTGF
jgi:hypothetical protein